MAGKKSEFVKIYRWGPVTDAENARRNAEAEAIAAQRIKDETAFYQTGPSAQYLERAYEKHVLPREAIFDRYASETGVDPKLLKAIVMVEQRGNDEAGTYGASEKGASGLTQVMPLIAKTYGINPADPQDAIRGMAMYVRDLQKKFGDDPSVLGAAYHAGETNIRGYSQAGADLGKKTREYAGLTREAYEILSSGKTPMEARMTEFGPTARLASDLAKYEKDAKMRLP